MESRWDTGMERITLITYDDTDLLFHRQNITPILGCEVLVNMLDQWEVLLVVMLGQSGEHPEFYNMKLLIDASEEVNEQIQVQARYQQEITEALVILIQNYFNKN